jgi:translation initiation factor 2B subunit (eIF-2B alpha/beta/delta family)
VIDWEHVEYRFIRPDELAGYDTVPRLEESLSRIMVGRETESALTKLHDDHQSGAELLALIALGELLKIVRGEDFKSVSTTQEFWRELRMVAWHLAKNGRPSMSAAIEAALFRVLDTVESELQRSAGMELPAIKSMVERSIEARIDARRHSLENLGKLFQQFIIDAERRRKEGKISTTTVATLSSSSTITKCLENLIRASAANDMSIKLSILESRPVFEGVAFANELLQSLEKERTASPNSPHPYDSLQVDISSDASVALAVKDANYVVIGADRVSSEGDVSNKIGSLAAAVLAKTLQPECNVVVVFETDKIAGNGDEVEHRKVEYNDAAEITNTWPAEYAKGLQGMKEIGYHVEVKNAYFEWVPAAYIDRYITEEGNLTVQDIVRLSKEKTEREERLFRDL